MLHYKSLLHVSKMFTYCIDLWLHVHICIYSYVLYIVQEKQYFDRDRVSIHKIRCCDLYMLLYNDRCIFLYKMLPYILNDCIYMSLTIDHRKIVSTLGNLNVHIFIEKNCDFS